MSSSATPPTLTLLTLPPEIRNAIYDHILTHDLHAFARTRRRPTLHHTCRQLRREYESTFLACPAIHYFAHLDLPFISHDDDPRQHPGAPYSVLDPARKRDILLTRQMLRPTVMVVQGHVGRPVREEGEDEDEVEARDREIAAAEARRGVEERSASLHRMGFPGVGYTAVVVGGTVSYSVFVDRGDYRATCGGGGGC